MDSGNSPPHRPPRCGMFFPFSAAEREHLGTSPFPTTRTRNRRYLYRDTSASFGNKSTDPHPFPSSLPRAARPGAVSRERQAGVVLHRKDTSPWKGARGARQASPGSAGLSREPSLRSCAISCPAPSTSRAVARQKSQDFGSTRELSVLSVPRHFQLRFQEPAGAADASYPWKSGIKVSKES